MSGTTLSANEMISSFPQFGAGGRALSTGRITPSLLTVSGCDPFVVAWGAVVRETITLEIRIKRVYETPGAEDGIRVLVDRLWPRGLSKDRAEVDLRAKELAPSDHLRKRFHREGDSTAFRKEYRQEVDLKDLDNLLERVKPGPVTLLYASRNERENNAQVLMQLIQERI